jgi:hypothetical protein
VSENEQWRQDGDGLPLQGVADTVRDTDPLAHLRDAKARMPAEIKADLQAAIDSMAHREFASGPLPKAVTVVRPIAQHGGSKYLRTIRPADGQGQPIKVDVYEALVAFGVTCPALQHAAKKILCAGLRQKGSTLDDLIGAAEAISRAIEMEQARQEAGGGV